jgi:hypothetical protein
MPMAAAALAVDTARMDSILIYCRPVGAAHRETLRAWIEHQATELAARPAIQRTALMHLSAPDASSRRNLGWLLECELTDAAGAPKDILRELLTDMRLIGLQPALFVAQPYAA